MNSHIDRNRPCGSPAAHVPHPWDHGRRWCKGAGKYAEDQQPQVVDNPGGLCDATWTGPTGIIWDCTGRAHKTDPTKGYAGSGHVMVARPRVR